MLVITHYCKRCKAEIDEPLSYDPIQGHVVNEKPEGYLCNKCKKGGKHDGRS